MRKLKQAQSASNHSEGTNEPDRHRDTPGLLICLDGDGTTGQRPCLALYGEWRPPSLISFEIGSQFHSLSKWLRWRLPGSVAGRSVATSSKPLDSMVDSFRHVGLVGT